MTAFDFRRFKSPYPALTHGFTVRSAELSPDGRLIVGVSGGKDHENGDARIWDSATGKLLQILPHAGALNCAAFSSDGGLLAMGGESKEARLFAVASGIAVGSSMRHKESIFAVGFSHDGRFLATGTVNAAQIWDVSTAQSVTPPLSHRDPVDEVFFLAGDQVLVTQSAGLYRFWPIQPSEHSLEDLLDHARLLGAHQIDSTSVILPLDLATLSNTWHRLHRKFPDNFRLLPARSASERTMPLKPVLTPVPISARNPSP